MNTDFNLKSTWERSTTRRAASALTTWRVLRRVLLTLAILATLVALFYAVENWRGRSAWAAHRRALEAAGEKLDLHSVVPPPIPDDQNFAMTPLLRSLFEYTRGPKGVQWHNPDGTNLSRRISIYLRGNPTNRDPALGNLEKGTLTDLEAFRQYYAGNTNYPQVTAPTNAAETVLTALSKFDLELKELHRAAAERPLSRFPVNYDEKPPLSILLPHMPVVRSLGQLVALHAIANLELGRSAEALADIELGLRLSSAVRNEPLMISHLVRLANLAVVLQSVREGLARHAWNPEQLTLLGKRLAEVDVLAEYQPACRGERAFGIESIDYIRGEGRADAANYLFEHPRDAETILLRLAPDGWLCQNMVRMSQAYQKHILTAVDIEKRQASPAMDDAAREALQEMPPRPYTIFVRILMPALVRVVVRNARMQTYVDAARIGVALEQYRLAQRKLPESLHVLAAQPLAAIPTDVIDGQPLRYRRLAEGGYLVYSVGWDETDDNGKLGSPDAPRQSADAEQGDWVWSMPGGR